MIIEIMLICSLTDVAPMYDCNEMWELHISDQRYPNHCKLLGHYVAGCAYFNGIYGNIIPMRMYVGTSDYIDYYGMTTLEHEIEHLKCRCDWHG